MADGNGSLAPEKAQALLDSINFTSISVKCGGDVSNDIGTSLRSGQNVSLEEIKSQSSITPACENELVKSGIGGRA